MQAFRFPVTVGTPAPTTFAANAALGTQRDAFSVPFAASDRAITDSVIESGAASEASVPIALTSGGTLQVTLANSIVPQFVVPSERAMLDDALPLADEAASRLGDRGALHGCARRTASSSRSIPPRAVTANLDKLLSLQRGDGGFGGFANAPESDPFATA